MCMHFSGCFKYMCENYIIIHSEKILNMKEPPVVIKYWKYLYMFCKTVWYLYAVYKYLPYVSNNLFA